MALQTFTPPKAPSVGAATEPKISLFETEFGDGYTARSPKGLNHVRETAELKFELLTASQSATVRAFLQQHGGYKPFLYTLPGETVANRFICKKWKRSLEEGDLQSITLSLEQDFSIAS